MFAGQKLLVAEDSPYYRTVISLTFTDEGMEVTTASDNQEALKQLEQFAPDVILANVSMPGISGYELCELIKQSERFSRIPVMLLVGVHEPFDEAEARRVGADDVVTKPFKSIRQLVSRVGSLLGGKTAEAEDPGHEYSTLGLARSENLATAAPDDQTMTDKDIPVYVEAASLSNPEPVESAVESAGSTCVADVELQTADTQQLERIDDEPAGEPVEPIRYAQDDTNEMEPVTAIDPESDSPEELGFDEQNLSTGVPEMNEQPNTQPAPVQTQSIVNDALLDLGDFDTPTQRDGVEDLFLDLDYEEPVSHAGVTVSETVPEPEAVFETASPAEANFSEPVFAEQPVAELQEWTIVTETPAEEPPPVLVREAQSSGASQMELSPETIDAIARRVVDQMSDKVVREIAWEVVPELAELLIKKKLDEQK